MEVHRKWYQFIRPWLGIIAENFTEEIIFQFALKGEQQFKQVQRIISDVEKAHQCTKPERTCCAQETMTNDFY